MVRPSDASQPRSRPPPLSSLLALSLVALGAVAGLLVVTFPSAEAMGNAPSTCNNRYDGTITSFLVTYPGGTLDPIASPNSTFTLYDDSTYNVTFTIHTQAQNSNRNTLGGTTWYDENVFGYYFGVCHPGEGGTSIGPNQDVNIAINGITHPCCSGYTVYQVTFSTFTQLQQPVTFKIRWQPAPAAPAITTSSSTTALSSSQAALGTPGLASHASSSASTAPATNSSPRAGTGTPSAPSLTATNVLAVTGLGIVAAYAVGWAMIRRLR